MTKVRNFSENLEKHLTRLGHDAARLRELPENRELPEREAVKQSLKSFSEEAAAPNPPPAVSSSESDSSAPAGGDFLPAYLRDSSEDGAKKAVERLVGMAMNDDLTRAVREAKKFPPFIEDAFHDALVDKLLPELKKRGIIK